MEPSGQGRLWKKAALAAAVVLSLIAGALFLPFSPVSILGRDSHDPQFRALRRLETDSDRQPVAYMTNGFPEAVRARVKIPGEDSVERARNFLAKYAALYKLGNPRIKLHVQRLEGPGDSTVVFYQTYDGRPVYHGELSVLVAGEYVYSTSGSLLWKDVSDMVPAITDSQAEETARSDLGDPNASILGETKGVVFDRSLLFPGPPNPRLAWRVTVAGPDLSVVVVDANTNTVLYKESTLSLHDGFDGFDLDLRDAENDASAEEDDCFWNSDEVDAGDEDGVYEDYVNDPDVVTAYNGAKLAYSFFHSEFGRHSYDGDEGQMEIYLHALVPGAPQTGYRVCDLDDVVEASEGNVAIDTMVHEWTHAVIHYTSNFADGGQTGSLDESYSDVMAALAEGDWIQGNGLVSGAPSSRNLSNPPDPGVQYPSPDKMSSDLYFTGPEDNYGEHYNSTVPSKAHFLMSEGGNFNGHEIDGIGKTKTGQLAFWTMTSLGSNANFLSARNKTVAYAQVFADLGDDLPFIPNGFTQQDVCSVMEAWAAVEVGGGDSDCNGIDDTMEDGDSDGVPDGLDNCPGLNWASLADADGDGKGDACDNDDDNDGVPESGGPNLPDNCPGVPNPDQTDANHNGKGAACDPAEDGDLDDDTVPDQDDNCPLDSNQNQNDVDNDGEGNACDPDADGDGLSNDNDNCPFTPNADQKNTDDDGAGDACDKCAGTDDVDSFTTGFPELGIDPHPHQPDSDEDGVPDACDPDLFNIGALLVDGVPYGLGALGDDLWKLQIPTSPGRSFKLPLDICLPKCPDYYQNDFRLRLMCTDPPPWMKFWIADDSGLIAGKPRKGSEGTFASFHPKGGTTYSFNWVFGQPGSPHVTLDCKLVQSKAGEGTTVDTKPAPEISPPVVVVPPAPPKPKKGATLSPPPSPPPSSPDFAINCDPQSISTNQNSSASSRCTTSSLNSFTGMVLLTCENLPANISCQFNPRTFTLPANAQVTSSLAVTVGRVANGTYRFDVVATSGEIKRRFQMQLTV